MSTVQRKRFAARYAPKGETFCIFCGCTDSRACAVGCAWLLRERRKQWGVCSGCEQNLKELDAQLQHVKLKTYFDLPPAMRSRS